MWGAQLPHVLVHPSACSTTSAEIALSSLISSRRRVVLSNRGRYRVAELLRVAAGDGRLSVEEPDQRLEKALTARALGEPAALSRDVQLHGHACGRVEHAAQHQPPGRRQRDVLGPVS
jgi:hypothetical protein